MKKGELNGCAIAIIAVWAVLGIGFLLKTCEREPPPPTVQVTQTPLPAPMAPPEDTPDALGMITAVGHVRPGTVLYHPGDGEWRGIVTEITMQNPVNHQRLETVIWQSKYGREVVPMKYMDMYRVRPEGQ